MKEISAGLGLLGPEETQNSTSFGLIDLRTFIGVQIKCYDIPALIIVLAGVFERNGGDLTDVVKLLTSEKKHVQ